MTEPERLDQFPVSRERVFVGHAGVTALPRVVADAMRDHIDRSCENHQEFGEVLRDVAASRAICARAIGAHADEIALLGPTSLGLSLFANGLDWSPGDELVCYRDDYPANVYPWTNLQRLGVKVRFVEPDALGRITVDNVAAALTDRTRLVALASCHFLTGWRIDIDAIGQLVHERGALFSLDAIQTLGAFPTRVDQVDLLSADAHKWMLGPLAIGIVYVAREHFAACRPTLLGAWNVKSPDFITQDEIAFPDTAQRYEPGVLNVTGMYGMAAALRLFEQVGPDQVSARILAVRDQLHAQLAARGYEFLSPGNAEPLRCGIVTARHPDRDPAEQFKALEAASITASLRNARNGDAWLRFSPHFYNTAAEMDRIVAALDA